MEKILQTSFRLPPLDSRSAEDYTSACARVSGTAGLFAPDLIALVADRCTRNPRRIKRLLNGLSDTDPADDAISEFRAYRSVRDASSFRRLVTGVLADG